MGFTLTADKAKVIRQDKTSSNGNPYTTYALMVSSKDRNEEWHNGFLEAMFPQGTNLTNKTVIKIKNAFPIVSEYNGKTYIKWYVNDYEVLEQNGSTPRDADGFMNVPEGVDEDLPFAQPRR